MNTFGNALALGSLQGIFEWLPVSSEGIIALAYSAFSSASLSDIVSFALFLHLGTFFAALVYFHAEVATLIRGLFSFQSADTATRQTLLFISIATLISGSIGYTLLSLIKKAEDLFTVSGTIITGIVALALFITAGLQFIRPKHTYRTEEDIHIRDGVVLGILQGFAVIPGISRSGITVSGLLLSRVREETALTLSFLLSLPIVLAGNVLLNWELFANFSATLFTALIASFAFGLATIHILLHVARIIPFRWFVLAFAVLTLVSLFI